MPGWLRTRVSPGAECRDVREVRKRFGLATVCEQARCPNRGECWSRRHATFLLLGTRCTRGCRFCSVEYGSRPAPPDPGEPARTAEAAARLGLRHCVLTSVTRDDLEDGGASVFARTVAALRGRSEASVELLIPDFGENTKSLRTVLECRPDVIGHNLETAERLHPAARPNSNYRRSLRVLGRLAGTNPRIPVKSAFMVGLGETDDEVYAMLEDLRGCGVDAVVIGQYLSPSSASMPVRRFVSPQRFRDYAERGRALGFLDVFAAPLARSSYLADALWNRIRPREHLRPPSPEVPEKNEK